MPYYANGKERGKGIALDSENDLANLVTFDEALAAAPRYAGLGFALGSDERGRYWQGIDLDGIQGAGLESLAARLPGYVEWSPSAKGMHAIGLGEHFKALGSNGSGIEAYCEKRYFTVTGNYQRGELCCLAGFVGSELRPLHSPLHRDTEAQGHRGTDSQDTQESQESQAREEGRHIGIASLPDYCKPTAPGMRNQILFKLARHLKTRHPEASAIEMLPIVKAWHAEYLNVIGTKHWIETWSDFTNAWGSVKYLEAEGPLVKAFDSIDLAVPIPESLAALGYDHDGYRVAELCRRLADLKGDGGRFFLGSRSLAKLIGLSAPSAAKVLRMLVAHQVLEKVEDGELITPRGPRAATYRFLGW